MDPSYNNSNGDDGSGGINPGDVTQPTVPVQSVPVQPEVPVQSVPAQSVAPSQSTVVSQPSRQINPITHRPMNPVASNPMASNAMPGMGILQQANFGMPQQTGFEMSQSAGFGASGDIILASAEKKKPKIGAVVLVVALILLVLGGVGVSIAKMVGNIGEQSGGNSIQDTFNKYANYFISGKQNDSSAEIEEKSLEETAFIQVLDGDMASDENNTNYYQQLKAYFDSFYNLYTNSDVDLDNEYSSVLSDYKDKLYLIVNYYGGHILDRSDILNAYLAGGEEAARQLISETLDVYKNIGDMYVMNYYDLSTREANLDLELISSYKSAGCITDGRINYECPAVGSVINEKEIEYTSVYYDRKVIINNSIDDLYFGIFEIRSIIYDDNLTTGEDDENS